MRVLVATDFSQVSPVIETVKARPWPAATEACLLHVVDPGPFESNSELLETARRGAESTAQSLASGLEQAGLKTLLKVIVGHPRRAIVEFAGKWGASFVVVGSHGANAMARFFLGSVAQSVVRAAPCPVLVVRPGAAGPHGEGFRILMATDGSDCAQLAARSIADRSWPAGSVVRIMSVAAPFMPVTDAGTVYFDPGQGAEVAQQVEADARSLAAESVARAKQILTQSSGVRIELSGPMTGDPKRVIVDQASAWKAAIVVVGSHGRHGLDRLLTGSVSEFVAMHAPCSVEVIR